jgi:hypothetical protein
LRNTKAIAATKAAGIHRSHGMTLSLELQSQGIVAIAIDRIFEPDPDAAKGCDTKQKALAVSWFKKRILNEGLTH